MKNKLQKRIISQERATEMAKNIFVHGGLKKLRENIRQYKKDEQALALNLISFKNREFSFKNKDWSVDDRPAFIQEKYASLQMKTVILHLNFDKPYTCYRVNYSSHPDKSNNSIASIIALMLFCVNLKPLNSSLAQKAII